MWAISSPVILGGVGKTLGKDQERAFWYVLVDFWREERALVGS
jgi:hypothetical protein